MRNIFSLFLAGMIIPVSLAGNVPEVERIVWAKKVVHLHLKTGKERTVIFPSQKISVSIDRRIDPFLQVTPLDGTLYIKAHKTFSVTRIQVTGEDNGQIYLLDLQASEKGSNNIVEILLPKRTRVSSPVNSQPGYVVMSRYAIQQIYAPRRLVNMDSRFTEVNVAGQKSRRLYRGGDIISRPHRSWRAGNLYVTAIQVMNDSQYPVYLDFRMIRGQGVWKSGVFQHASVTRKGTLSDQTFMYLVSSRPFDEINYEEAIE